MTARDFAWFESELARRLVEKQKLNSASDMEIVIRELDSECLKQLTDEALIFTAERFSRYGRQPWSDARGRVLAEMERRKVRRERTILIVAVATLVVAVIGVAATIAAA